MFTGYDYVNKQWQNLQANFSLRENSDNYISWRTSYELTRGQVKDSRIQIGKSITNENIWKIRSEIMWNYIDQAYKVPYVDVIRDMGCVELIYRYRDYNHEHTFLFRVNAFPDQTLGATIGDEGSTFQGWEQRDVYR